MNLLSLMNNGVYPTSLTRKITLNGITQILPVYKIDLDLLYYNDQNDRIASWISQFKDEQRSTNLLEINRKEYNSKIEGFIVSSNPAAIEKTQMNIEIVGQREPGVVLSDGRIIDGNRRYTCLRRLRNKSDKFGLYEAIILDLDINDNKKMIKMLELSIQHGEEKRVDYNHVEKLIGIYQDIIESELLTIQEYAVSTNESINEIKRKVEASKILVEFLDYIGLSKQFHIAREYQVVSNINDLLDVVKICPSSAMIENIKHIYFLNTLMNTVSDGRRFFKNIKLIISTGKFDAFCREHKIIEDKTMERLHTQRPTKYYELQSFVRNNYDIANELKFAFDDVLNDAKVEGVHRKPAQIVTKTINSLRELDTNVLVKLSDVEKENVKNQLSYLNNVIEKIEDAAGVKSKSEKIIEKTNVNEEIVTPEIFNNYPIEKKQGKKEYIIIPSSYLDFVLIKNIENNTITSSNLNLKVRLSNANDDANYVFYFIDDKGFKISNEVRVELHLEDQLVTFNFVDAINKIENCYLGIKKEKDEDNELRFLLEYKVKILFSADF